MRASSSSSGVASPASVAPTRSPASLDAAAVGRTLTQTVELQQQTRLIPPPTQHQRRRSGLRQSSAEVRRGPLVVSEESTSTSAPLHRSSPQALPPPPPAPARRQSPVSIRQQHRPRQSSADSHRGRITNEASVSHRTQSVAGPIPSKGSSGRGVRPRRPHSSPTVHGSPQRLSATLTSVAPRSDSRQQTQLAYGVTTPQHRPPSYAGLSRDTTPDPQHSPPQSPPQATSPLQHTQESTVSYTQDSDTHTRTMAEKGAEEITTEAVSPMPTLSLDKVKATWEGEGQESDSGGGRAESPPPPFPPPPSDAETPPPTSGNTTATSVDRPHAAEEAPSTAVPTAAASTDTHDARHREQHQHVHPHHHHPFMSNPMCDHPHHHHQHTKYSEESENEGKAKGVRNRSQFHHDDESVGATSRGSSSEGVPGPCSAAGPSGRTVTRLLIVGWDKTRTRIMIALLAIFVVWVCIFFPLLGQM